MVFFMVAFVSKVYGGVGNIFCRSFPTDHYPTYCVDTLNGRGL